MHLQLTEQNSSVEIEPRFFEQTSTLRLPRSLCSRPLPSVLSENQLKTFDSECCGKKTMFMSGLS